MGLIGVAPGSGVESLTEFAAGPGSDAGDPERFGTTTFGREPTDELGGLAVGRERRIAVGLVVAALLPAGGRRVDAHCSHEQLFVVHRQRAPRREGVVRVETPRPLGAVELLPDRGGEPGAGLERDREDRQPRLPVESGQVENVEPRGGDPREQEGCNVGSVDAVDERDHRVGRVVAADCTAFVGETVDRAVGTDDGTRTGRDGVGVGERDAERPLARLNRP